MNDLEHQLRISTELVAIGYKKGYLGALEAMLTKCPSPGCFATIKRLIEEFK